MNGGLRLRFRLVSDKSERVAGFDIRNMQVNSSETFTSNSDWSNAAFSRLFRSELKRTHGILDDEVDM